MGGSIVDSELIAEQDFIATTIGKDAYPAIRQTFTAYNNWKVYLIFFVTDDEVYGIQMHLPRSNNGEEQEIYRRMLDSLEIYP